MVQLSPDANIRNMQHATAPASGHEAANGHAAAAPPAEQKQGRGFNQNEFKKGTDTGTEIDAQGREKPKEKMVTIREHTAEQYSNFLQDYITEFSRFYQENPALREDPSNAVGVLLIDKLMTEGKPDASKINILLSTSSGLVTADQIMSQYNTLLRRANGLVADIMPEGDRTTAVDDITQRAGNRGMLNAIWHDKIVPAYFNTRNRVITAGILAPIFEGTLAGTMSGSVKEGIAAGAIVAGAEVVGAAGYKAYDSATRNGITLRLTPNKELFEAMQNDPTEKAFLKQFAGIDIDNLQFNSTTNKIEPKPERVVESVREPKKIGDEIVKLTNARKDFFTDIGIGPKQFDLLPEEIILNNSIIEKGFEQTDLAIGDEIIKQFDANKTGIKDTFGRSPDDPNFCIPMGPFPPGVIPTRDFTHLDTLGNIQRFNKAREAVVLRKALEATKHIQDTPNEGLRAGIKAKKDAFTNGTETTNRTKEAQDKKIKLQEEKGKVEEKKEALKGQAENQNASKKIEQQLADEFKIAPADIDTEITKLQAEIDTAYGGGAGLQDQFIQVSTDLLDTYSQAVEDETKRRVNALTAAGTTRGNVDNAAVEKYANDYAQLKHGKQAEQLRKNFEDRTGKIKKLTDIKKEYEAAVKTRTETENQSLKDTPKDLSETQKAYKDLITRAGATITSDDLDKKTIDELIKDAVKPPYNEKNKTPEQQAELRQKIIRAKTERQALKVEEYDKSPAEDPESFNDIINVAGATQPITANDLFAMPEQQLLHILTSDPAYTAAGALHRPAADALREAQREANKKLRIRYPISLDEQIKDFDKQIEMQDNKIKEVSNLGSTPDALIQTEALLDRQGEVFTQALKINKEPDKYTDITSLKKNIDTTFSEQELAAKGPKGYYEMLNVLFNYQTNPKRGETFQQISQIFPPDRIARLLHDAFNLGLAAPGKRVKIEDVLSKMNGEIKATHDISDTQLYVGFRNIVNRIAAEAIAA